jgi:hypothetical protein
MTRQIAIEAMRTALLLWVCLHVVLGFLEGPSFGVASVIFVPGIIAALVFLDQRISHEAVFVANLGIRPSIAPIAAGLTTALLELAALALLV